MTGKQQQLRTTPTPTAPLPPLPKQGSAETHRPKQTDTHAAISRNRGRAKTHRHRDRSRSLGNLQTVSQEQTETETYRLRTCGHPTGTRRPLLPQASKEPPPLPRPPLQAPPPALNLYPGAGSAATLPSSAPAPTRSGRRARRGRAGSARLANPLRAGGAARVNPWRPALQGRRKGQEADVPLEASRAAGNPSLPRGWSRQKLGRGRPRARTHPPCAAAAAAVPRVPRADPAPMAGPYFMLPSPGGKCGRAPWGRQPPAPPRQAGSERAAPAPPAQSGSQGRPSKQAARPELRGRPRQAHGPRSPGAALAPASLFSASTEKEEEAEEEKKKDDQTFGGGLLAVPGDRARPGEGARRAVEAASPPAWGRRGKGRIWGK